LRLAAGLYRFQKITRNKSGFWAFSFFYDEKNNKKTAVFSKTAVFPFFT